MSNVTPTKLQWTPWHKVVALRDDVRTGELSLAMFAADLYEVKTGSGRKVYVDPAEFFALTYPTGNLRDLARDVIVRLAGKNTKAIRQLELTYGGGKTHTLITLYHLVNNPAALPDLPAVREFREHIALGKDLPRARIAVLAFDKIDDKIGQEDVPSPADGKRTLKYPWSILAWQIGGLEGLRTINGGGSEDERDTPPAQPLMEKLLRIPDADGLGTLILIDEVLMYAHQMVSRHPEWLNLLKNFFQYLCQAVVKSDRAAIVASLLATDPSKSDALGKQVILEISEIFAREREEGVQPVLKEDVAEVLRRRFFKPESISVKDAFREHVIAAMQGILDLDDATKKDKKKAEVRFLDSYPFHPDLTEVFYSKWTSIDSFQKTRGILRTFALALRDSEKWDNSPLVGPNVFLAPEGKDNISEATRELTGVATKEQTEGGGQQNWTAILESELLKARGVQDEFPSLRHREIEQAVMAVFLHSQPVTKHASLSELVVLIGATRPDRITLEKGLRLWFDRSWFLDESTDTEARSAPGQPKALPNTWRLGSKPNLRQMHDDAVRTRIPEDLVEARLMEDIRKLKNLTSGASAAGAVVHMLPEKPSDIDDDGEFHYAVLGPDAASESGKPSSEARRYLEENTGPSNPRKERNAVVLAVPSRDGLIGARQSIKEYLGWEEVKSALKNQDIDPIRAGMLASYADNALRKIPGTVVQAYCIVVTVSDTDDVHAFKIQVGDKPLFQAVKEDKRSRIQDVAISADAILPGGPYDLWREGEDARRVKDIVGAFARFSRLPKMMNRRAILETIINGCLEGVFVGRITRADRSVRTFWRQRPDDVVLNDSSFEVVLPRKALLTELQPNMLYPQAIKELWVTPELTVSAVRAFFSGKNDFNIDRGGYQEALPVPEAPDAVVDNAIAGAVKDGKLWLTNGPSSFLSEELPAGTLTDQSTVQPPPLPIGPTELLPEKLGAAWGSDTTTAVAIVGSLSQRLGKNLPWTTVRDAIDGAIRARILERTPDSGPWPCEFPGASAVRLRLATGAPLPPTPPSPTAPTRPGSRVGEAELKPGEVQDLADVMGDLLKARGGYEIAFRIRIEIAGKEAPPDGVVAELNKVLKGIGKGLEIR